MHHHFSSRYHIDTLHSFVFASSYSKTKKFEKAAAFTNGEHLLSGINGKFVQFIADNADHNANTIDGKGTLHAMGMAAVVTPAVRKTVSITR
jgi:hypothetical protein